MEKLFETTLILDWKTGKFRVYKHLRKACKPSEIPISLSLKVKIPEKPTVTARGEINLSEEKVSEIVIDSL